MVRPAWLRVYIYVEAPNPHHPAAFFTNSNPLGFQSRHYSIPSSYNSSSDELDLVGLTRFARLTTYRLSPLQPSLPPHQRLVTRPLRIRSLLSATFQTSTI